MIPLDFCYNSDPLCHPLHSNLEPGGYVEVQDIDLFIRSDDGTLEPDGPLMKWTNLLYDATHKLGRPYVELPSLKDVLVETDAEECLI